MCLSIPDLEDRRITNGEYLGLEFEVVQNHSGYRCGYIRVLPGHPWFGIGEDDIYAEVHGGVTFASYGTPCPTHGEKSEWWVGFDCAHYGDAPDPTLKGYPANWLIMADGKVRDTKYVLKECRSLARQAVAASLLG